MQITYATTAVDAGGGCVMQSERWLCVFISIEKMMRHDDQGQV